jgi:hypothetical protein
MKPRCKKKPLVTKERIKNKKIIAAEMQTRGLLESGGNYEITDYGIYKVWSTPDRLNRKKVACFLDNIAGFMVCLPQACPDYCRECDRDHGRISAI